MIELLPAARLQLFLSRGDRRTTFSDRWMMTGENTMIVVIHLDSTNTEVWLKETFSRFGTIVNIDRPIHRSGQRKPLAFIQYATREEAESAVRAMSNYIF
jgi:RNA recognition motif-containing protein